MRYGSTCRFEVLYTVRSAHNMSDWQIEQPCPQCGAPVTLEEADQILSCIFCRTRHILVTRDYFRYVITPPSTVDGDLFYIPYWRLKGLSFSIEESNIVQCFIDMNMLASPMQGLPPSLGFRPQVLKLKFYSDALEGALLPYGTEKREAIINNQAQSTTGLVRYIGEVMSLVYSPFYIKDGRLYDAFEKKPLSGIDLSNLEFQASLSKRDDWKPIFLPTLCPQCGWDLLSEKDSNILLCRNCHSAWTGGGTALEPVLFNIITPPSDLAGDWIYLPFWRMKIKADGVELSSYADLIRLANLPRMPTEDLEKKQMLFWSPAFKVNPALFLRWCRQMTVFQPEGEVSDKLPKEVLYPITLPLEDAVDGTMITLASIMADK
ncbi:MAG: hypothetical protein ABSB79_11120, partial [Syntrophales bacterium]